VESAEVDLTAVTIQERPAIQTCSAGQSVDVLLDKKNIAGSVPAAVGTTDASEAQSSAVKRFIRLHDSILGALPDRSLK
jgi:hypothetical protein